MGKREKDKYGNVTFGEATELLIDIIKQNVILDLVKKNDEKKGAYKKKLEEIYDGKRAFSKLSTATKGSPQWYFSLFFKTILEDKYNLSPLAMITVDSFTWQFFYALTHYTPFEKLKSETAMFHLRKQVFCFIYDLLKRKPIDGIVNKISSDSIKDFLIDSYNDIFSNIEDKFKDIGKNFHIEIKDYWKEKNKDNPKPKKTVSLEKVINELINDNGIFFKELKESYSDNIDDLKTEKPKLYALLISNENIDNFTQLFKDAVEEFINKDLDNLKIIIEEIEEFSKTKINYQNFCNYIKSNKTNYNLDDNISNWRHNEDVYNATWKKLEFILDYLHEIDFLPEKDKITYTHRLISLYLRKNAQRAMKKILYISKSEQERIIEDIKTMINNKNRKPEEFYMENDSDFFEQKDLIYLCLVYQHHEDFDPVKSNEIINKIESKCFYSKYFFSPWLNARAKVFETGKILKKNKELKALIINGYKKAYDEGIAYAGCYLSQFIFEAIVINKFYRREGSNYYGYGYALELFKLDEKESFESFKEKLNKFIKGSKNTEPGKDFIDIHYSCNPCGKQILQDYPNLQYNSELENEAINLNDEGLKYEKNGDFETAKKYFSNALILNPVYVNAYSNRGNLYIQMSEKFIDKCEQFTKNALTDYNIALLLNPKHENTLFNRGLLFYEKKEYGEAIKDFTEVININSKALDAYFSRGNCYKYINRFDLAIKDYNKAKQFQDLTHNPSP
jgi:Tfp pilus assembly protein PilF